ncbi:hypothetical protein F4809DRAFT_645771 [Biscogniauxia mediterranea]|nr:hypothetical protein F4809DRAFT_645771 [Biscogniauxia mediterranea]
MPIGTGTAMLSLVLDVTGLRSTAMTLLSFLVRNFRLAGITVSGVFFRNVSQAFADGLYRPFGCLSWGFVALLLRASLSGCPL